MSFDLAVIAIIYIVMILSFNRFEERAPAWRRIVKVAIIFGIFAVITTYAGRPWNFMFFGGLSVIGSIGHYFICRKHGIDPLNAAPRLKYFELRGWDPA